MRHILPSFTLALLVLLPTSPAPALIALLSTPAGSPGQPGSTDASGALARFAFPNAITLSADASFALIADSGNDTIRHVDLQSGAVTTLAGSPGQSGSADGTGMNARFAYPSGIALSHDGSFAMVADTDNQTIRRIDLASGAVTTLAGSPGQEGQTDGRGSQVRFAFPHGLALSNDDSFALIANFSGSTIRMLRLASASVSTLAGSPAVPGSRDGPGGALAYPGGIDLDSAANIAVIADTENQTIRKLTLISVTPQVYLPHLAREPALS